MGLDERHYARENQDRGGWGGQNQSSILYWPVWQKLVAINIVVFLLQIFITRPMTIDDFGPQLDRLRQFAPEGQRLSEKELQELAQQQITFMPPISVVQKWFELDTDKVLRGQVWRVVTAGFCHDRMGIWHLLFNMLFLYWFGHKLEFRYGPTEFCAFYFASLLASSFAYMALDLYTGNMIPAIGASGAVWGVVALYAMLYPYDKIYIYFLFPVQIRFLALIYFAFDLHPVLLALNGTETSSGIAHAAHVGGALFGFFYWYRGIQLAPLVNRLRGKKQTQRWANSRPQSRPRKYDNDSPQILQFPGVSRESQLEREHNAKMDTILEKISSQGRESLTEDELAFLISASERLKGKGQSKT